MPSICLFASARLPTFHLYLFMPGERHKATRRGSRWQSIRWVPTHLVQLILRPETGRERGLGRVGKFSPKKSKREGTERPVSHREREREREFARNVTSCLLQLQCGIPSTQLSWYVRFGSTMSYRPLPKCQRTLCSASRL